MSVIYIMQHFGADGALVRSETRKRIDAARYVLHALVYEAADCQALRDRPIAWTVLREAKAFDPSQCFRLYRLGDHVITARAIA